MIRGIFLSLILVFANFGPGWAGSKFVVGVEELTYLPYYSMETGTYSGYARELLDKFAANRGYTFEYKAFPVIRLLTEFLNGTVDLKFPDNKNWAGDKKGSSDISYSDGIVGFIDGVMVKPENINKGVESLKTLGTTLGFTPFEYLGLIKSGKVVLSENPKLENLLTQTISDRIDGAYVGIASGQAILEKIGKKGALEFNPKLPNTHDSYSLSTIKHKSLIKELNEFLVSNQAYVLELKTKYGVEKY